MEGGGLTFSVRFLLAVFISESVTVMETLKLGVVVVVVPLIVPVKRPMESPGGKPASVHEYPTPDPPVACTVNEYIEPCTASGNAFVVIVSSCPCPGCATDSTTINVVSERKNDFGRTTFRHRLGIMLSSLARRSSIREWNRSRRCLTLSVREADCYGVNCVYVALDHEQLLIKKRTPKWDRGSVPILAIKIPVNISGQIYTLGPRRRPHVDSKISVAHSTVGRVACDLHP
jgi:hypothetical protein